MNTLLYEMRRTFVGDTEFKYYDLVKELRQNLRTRNTADTQVILAKYYPHIYGDDSLDDDEKYHKAYLKLDYWFSEWFTNRGYLIHQGRIEARNNYISRNALAYLNKLRIYKDTEECADCGQVAWTDNMICTDRDEWVGEECNCSSNYRWHDGHDCYYHEDDYPYEDDDDYEEDYDPDYVLPYDANVLNWLPQEVRMPNDTKDEILMGGEHEAERRRDCPDDIVDRILGTMRGFALLKNDGSLDNGFEIVTAPATLNAQKHYWSKFCAENFNEHLSAWHTNTCGFHIHVSRKSLTPLDIGKLLVFVNAPNNSSFIRQIAGRSSDQWARRSAKSVKDGLNRSDKYEAINLGKERTIEFRIFRGNIGKLGIMRTYEFVHALVMFVKQSALDKDTDVQLKNLTYTNLIKFVGKPNNRSQYPYFYTWLVKQGYINSKRKDNSEVLECA